MMASSAPCVPVPEIQQSKQTVQQLIPDEAPKAILDAFNAHDLHAIMEFLADDCWLDIPRGPAEWGQRYVGKAAVREGLATRFQGSS